MATDAAEHCARDIARATAEVEEAAGWAWSDARAVLLNAAYGCGIYGCGIYGRDAERRVGKILSRIERADSRIRAAQDELHEARSLIRKMIADRDGR
jgi:hypothetical protein